MRCALIWQTFKKAFFEGFEVHGRGRTAMTTVRELLSQKGRNVCSIHPDATVFDAVAKMAEQDIGPLVVLDGEKFIGIITERHYARKIVLKGKTSPETQCGTLWTNMSLLSD